MDDYAKAEALQEGETIEVGDQTEEEVFFTVDSVQVEESFVLIYTKELAYPLFAKRGELVNYGNE